MGAALGSDIILAQIMKSVCGYRMLCAPSLPTAQVPGPSLSITGSGGWMAQLAARASRSCTHLSGPAAVASALRVCCQRRCDAG